MNRPTQQPGHVIAVLRRVTALAALLLAAAAAAAETLTVGAGRQFARIEDANAAAQPGDRIEVYPAEGDGVYRRPAVNVTKAGLHFVGMGDEPIVLDGAGFDYSGVGSTPRAIFQLNADADGVVIEHFELRGARNASHNAAGARINQADAAVVRRCRIHDNQMGIMSNGATGDPASAANQVIEFCEIFANGEPADPGYNHNLYLGGTSVTVRFCDIHSAVTGHNLKSRAHFNLIAYCHIHDSANHEIDLVDAWDTSRPASHSVLLGNFIVKRENTSGNRAVIHFGQDGGGGHDGTLYLLHNTIVTTYLSTVVQLSASQAQAELVNNIIYNPVQASPQLFSVSGGAAAGNIRGGHNWLSRDYSIAGTRIDPTTTYRGEQRDSDPGFENAPGRDYRLARRSSSAYEPNEAPVYLDGDGAEQSGVPAFQYRPVAGRYEFRAQRPIAIGAGIVRPEESPGGEEIEPRP